MTVTFIFIDVHHAVHGLILCFCTFSVNWCYLTVVNEYCVKCRRPVPKELENIELESGKWGQRISPQTKRTPTAYKLVHAQKIGDLKHTKS
jgi:hypothetical protein